jgi:hypothetical protein
MKEKNFPLLVFLFGLTLGVIGGGAVVYFAKDKEGRNMISVDLVPDLMEKVFGLMKKNEKSTEKNSEAVQASGNQPSSVNTTAAGQGTANNEDGYFSDSLSADTTIDIAATDEDPVILQRDELVGTGSVEIINLDYKTEAAKELKNDSLIAEAAEIKPEARITESRVSWMVEYWSSPVNYRGYRVGKNKLILFGIDPDAPLKAYFYNGEFFLKSNEGIFELQYSGDFLPFIKTNNSGLISAIGNKS